MIVLHTVKGEAFAINAGLIERVEGAPETHVTLVNGTSYLVKEPLEEVVRLHREDRAIVQSMASGDRPIATPSVGPPVDGPLPLRLVGNEQQESECERP